MAGDNYTILDTTLFKKAKELSIKRKYLVFVKCIKDSMKRFYLVQVNEPEEIPLAVWFISGMYFQIYQVMKVWKNPFYNVKKR